ncbi:hypothetical protein GALMADRAFT_1312811 [Galerina marginata CBS 339.88]|uniref:Uncharacterized protein n=1 Tax=Galerina marginata (strain CBS 339.88) TaxID=685588 RepID=A0A067TH44_GALM3|nr:hypothetical protein GALMADRAFT_1312811 [Galerina marginata CBS 339.88]
MIMWREKRAYDTPRSDRQVTGFLITTVVTFTPPISHIPPPHSYLAHLQYPAFCPQVLNRDSRNGTELHTCPIFRFFLAQISTEQTQEPIHICTHQQRRSTLYGIRQ